MKQDVVIEIFGKLETAEALAALSFAAAEEGTIDWGSGMDESEAASRLIECADDGKAFILTRQDTGILFDEVTSACQEHGLSYVMTMGDTGSEGHSHLVAWTPEMEREQKFDIDGDDTKPMIGLAELKAATKGGMDSVNSLVARIEAGTLQKVQKKIEVSPEAKAAYFADAEAVEPTLK